MPVHSTRGGSAAYDPPMAIRTTLVAFLFAVLVAPARAKPPIECVTLASTDGALVPLVAEPTCTIATHPLAATELPDLAFAPPLCFVSTFTGKLALDGRPTDGLAIVAHSGVSTSASGAALAAMPSPLVDGGGTPRPLIPFTAATVIEVRNAASGKVIGQLVTRDTGWGELDLATALPSFASERLAVTRATGPLFRGARGELVFSGDQFGAGGTARGTLCGPRMRRRVEKALR